FLPPSEYDSFISQDFFRVDALPSTNNENKIFNPEGCNVLSEKLPDLDSTKDLHPHLHNNPLSGSTTYLYNSLLEEFADEFPPEYDDNLQFDIESDLKEIEFMLYQAKDSSLKDRLIKRIVLILLMFLLIPHPRCSPMNILLIIHPL
nr:hypothetical protein [Tanacetum cinerariifolium]